MLNNPPARISCWVDRIFILSPANSGGQRANLLCSARAGFDLARRLQKGEKVAVGEIFSFVSGLYFRGKLVYSVLFGKPPRNLEPAYVITSNRGLLPVASPISLQELRAFATVPIDPGDPNYREPLRKSARKLAVAAGPECEIVLLGSIGTKKYAEILLDHFGPRLLFPSEFVGRGDMSRGGLLLRQAAQKEELSYVPVIGAVRRGRRPQKLPPRSWGYRITEGKTPVP